MKQAKDDAEAEIADYKSKKEAEFEAYKNQVCEGFDISLNQPEPRP